MHSGTSPLDISRRDFSRQIAASIGTLALNGAAPQDLSAEEATRDFSLKYILGSPMYGTAPLDELLSEAGNIGAWAIDIWPRPHANHHEQMEQLGFDRVEQLFTQHDVRLGMMTRYDLGPQRIHEEMSVLSRFGGKLLVCGAGNLAGDTDKERVQRFLTQLRKQVAEAEKRDIAIGIENHSGSLLHSPDSLRYFADLIESEHLGLAMAPYHLPQDPQLIADLIEHFGTKLVFFVGDASETMGTLHPIYRLQEAGFVPVVSAPEKRKYQTR